MVEKKKYALISLTMTVEHPRIHLWIICWASFRSMIVYDCFDVVAMADFPWLVRFPRSKVRVEFPISRKNKKKKKKAER